MRTAHRLLLLAAAAIAAMALGATSASATSAVEVSEEPSGTHCGEVSVAEHEASGGCEISATGEADLYAHTGTSEVLFSSCENTFEGNINEEGSGFITHQTLTDPGGGVCNIEPCDEAEPSHANLVWPFKSAELFPGHEVLGVSFCVRAFDPDSEGQNGPPCRVVVDVVEETPHRYAFEANGVPCLEAPETELHGSWLLDDSNIEITHL